MWWFGWCAGSSCYWSHVTPSSPWADLRPLSTSRTLTLARSCTPRPIPSPGLYTARHGVTQELVALKVLDRRLLRQRATRRRLRQEIRVLRLAKGHPNLLQLYEVKAVGTTVELVFELARGGNVLPKLRSEHDASHVLQQAARGLQVLHEQKIVHGEVRPEHLLFSDDEVDARVLLAGFGRAAPWKRLALHCRPKKTRGFLWDNVHHLRFLPPLLLRRKNRRHGEHLDNKDDNGRRLFASWREAQQMDIWALGVTLYVMLCGAFPFSSGDDRDDRVADIERRMLQDRLTFPADGTLLSRAARDLLRRLLAKKPETAMTINDVVAHPWLNGSVAPAVRWNADMLVQHDAFATRYAEEVAAEAHRPSGSTSQVVDVHNEVASAVASGVNTRTGLEGARSRTPSAGAILKRDILEMEAEAEEDARSSFMSTHGTQLLLNDTAQQERPSADCFMRLASFEMEGQTPNNDDNDVVADPSTSQDAILGSRSTTDIIAGGDGKPITRQKSLDKIWQVLLRQRRFFAKSRSSGSSMDSRAETFPGNTE